MAIEIKPETIKEIADYLEIGMLCFYHKPTGELAYYPEGLEYSGLEDLWAHITGKIEASPADFLQIEKMSSHEAFRVMENFIAGINHIPTHEKFTEVISRKKPFRQFNALISEYPDLREQWCKYKKQCYIAFVKEQIDLSTISQEPFNE